MVAQIWPLRATWLRYLGVCHVGHLIVRPPRWSPNPLWLQSGPANPAHLMAPKAHSGMFKVMGRSHGFAHEVHQLTLQVRRHWMKHLTVFQSAMATPWALRRGLQFGCWGVYMRIRPRPGPQGLEEHPDIRPPEPVVAAAQWPRTRRARPPSDCPPPCRSESKPAGRAARVLRTSNWRKSPWKTPGPRYAWSAWSTNSERFTGCWSDQSVSKTMVHSGFNANFSGIQSYLLSHLDPGTHPSPFLGSVRLDPLGRIRVEWCAVVQRWSDRRVRSRLFLWTFRGSACSVDTFIL